MSRYLTVHGDRMSNEIPGAHFIQSPYNPVPSSLQSSAMFPVMTLEPPTPCQPLGPGITFEEELLSLGQGLPQDDRHLSRDWSSGSAEQLSYDSSTFSDSSSRAEFSTPVASPSQASSTESSPVRRKPLGRVRRVDSEKDFVKRPLNSFMLYRKDHQHRIPTNNHQSISRIIGDMWRKETAETKNHYDNLAKSERERHLLEHPGYKFQPRKRKDPKGSKTNIKSVKKNDTIEGEDFDIGSMQRTITRMSSPSSRKSTLTAAQAQVMERETPQLSFWESSSPLSMSSAFPFPNSNPSNILDLPDQFAHYGADVDCFYPEPSDDQFPSGSPLQDPQIWHGIHSIPIRSIAAPIRRNSETCWPHLDDGEYALPQSSSVPHPRTLDNQMSLSFSEWEEQQIHLHRQRRDLDNLHFSSSVTSVPIADESLFHPVELYDSEYYPNCDGQYHGSEGFAPGLMNTSWELDSVNHH